MQNFKNILKFKFITATLSDLAEKIRLTFFGTSFYKSLLPQKEKPIMSDVPEGWEERQSRSTGKIAISFVT